MFFYEKSDFTLLSVCCHIFFLINKTTEEEEIQAPSLHSRNAILLNEDGKILYEKNADEIIYPASLTKIMTAIVAIEASKDLQRHVTIDAKTISTYTAQNASMAGFKAGNFVTIEDLLYGAILTSGADATATLAKVIAGDEATFVARMNDKARVLGMDQTTFVNVSGLHDEAHVSSVQDISKLFRYAIENPMFYQILTTRSYATTVPDELVMTNTLFTKMAGVEDAILGGKTGYTPEAGLCLASIIEKDGKHYLFVTANAEGYVWTAPFHIVDALSAHEAL